MLILRILFGLLLYSILGLSQTNTSLDTLPISEIQSKEPTILSTVTIYGKKQVEPFQNHIVQSSNRSIIENLSDQVALWGRSFGGGTSVSTTVRGGNPNQFKVLWNDMEVINPMLGQADLSLLKGALHSEAIIDKGGSVLSGGGQAGTLALNFNSLEEQDSSLLKLRLTGGSFLHRKINVEQQQTFKQWHFAQRVFYEAAENNYPITFAGIDRQLSNAKHQVFSWAPSLIYKINEPSEITLNAWYQENSRQIPPQINQNQSQARQTDYATRIALSYTRNLRNLLLKINSGHSRESISYIDQNFLQPTISHFNSWQQLLKLKYISQRTKQLFNLNIKHQYFTGNILNYDRPRSINKWSFNLGYENRVGALIYKIQAKRVVQNQTWSPLLYGLTVQYGSKNTFKADLRIERQFRFPTLNDLYWIPGGNQNLNPEEGWSADLNIVKARDLNQYGNIELSFSPYFRRTNQLIRWLPSEDNTFWSPINFSAAQTLGFETKIDLSLTYADEVKQAFSIAYSLTEAISLDRINIPRIEKGDQLWYVPKHQINLSYRLKAKFLNIQYNHTVTSEINGLNGNIPTQNQGNVRITLKRKRTSPISIGLRLENIWNSTIFFQENRIAPGRHYFLDLNYTFI